MKITLTEPPRVFSTGNERIKIKDCVHIKLERNEQVTFVTESGTEYDVVRKDWGYYATPSLNGRLKSFNLRGVLIKNSMGKFYILLVEQGKEDSFMEYLKAEKQKIVMWLDSD